jgi:hypothetical protein
MRPSTMLVGAVLLMPTAAWADRALTDAEQSKLQPAVAQQGCSGGKMQFDDGKFEVDDAKCNDGKIYDLSFDREYRLQAETLSAGELFTELASALPILPNRLLRKLQ